MLFTTIAQMGEKSLLKSMRSYLVKNYPKNDVTFTNDFILCKGNCPIMLVAHMDTVFKNPPKKIYYDSKYSVIWSPEGLGADDRAGVFLIWKIVQSGLRPHICLTTGEEWGGIGADALVGFYPNCPVDVKYIVELDRQGSNDCVFYSCANEKFENFVEDYGFVTDWGTFTDISVICPKWGIAGVNVSVGYVNEHTHQEILHTKFLLSTYNKVTKMIKEIDSAPYFDYIKDPFEDFYKKIGNKYFTYSYAETTHICNKCGKVFVEDDMFPVYGKDGNKFYLCLDCIDDTIKWCENCGEPYEGDTKYCPKCMKK